MREALVRATDVGARRAMGLCLHALGAVQFLLGEWDAAASALARSIDLARSSGGAFGEVLGEQRLGLLETAQGRYLDARERLQRALDNAQRSHNPLVLGHGLGRVLATLARNRFEAGDYTGAADYLAQGFAVKQQVGECASCDVLLYHAAVPIYLALGDLTRAEHACQKADEVSRAFSSRAWIAAARYLRGLFDARRGAWSGAVGALESARDLYAALDQPYDLARCLEALAHLAHHTEIDPLGLDADELREQALVIYRNLGAEGDRRRLEANPADFLGLAASPLPVVGAPDAS